MDPNTDIRFLAVARIARARGNRGEVLADLHTDYPDRFASLREVWLVDIPAGEEKPVRRP